MSFISFEYPLFFFIVFILYFSFRLRQRWILLFIASYFFYASSRAEYIFLLAFSTLVDYSVGLRISQTPAENKKLRQLLLLLSISVNLGVLGFFKYFNFFSESTVFLFEAIDLNYSPPIHNLILPVGISFYTFQSMAYTFDVYRDRVKPERNFLVFATYISFFPQLVAGPIERAPNLLPQFHKVFAFDYDRVVSGLRLILWGVFKKVVIANRMAIYVNAVYNDVEAYSGRHYIVATVFFAFQIYCDFSGYSDIAIGSARILGFDLMDNFRQPYFSLSIREFWRRWHISLSTWFRDYVYIPLGGNRVGSGRNILNLMVVFILSGLWHGASWTFVIWGTLHGTFLVLEFLYSRWGKRPRLRKSLAMDSWRLVITFSVVCFSWIFFRANTLDDATHIVTHLFVFDDTPSFQPLIYSRFGAGVEYLLNFFLIFLLMGIEWANTHYQLSDRLFRSTQMRWAFYYLACLVIFISLIDAHAQQQFIYFQF